MNNFFCICILDIPVQRFPRWKYPLIISSVLFIWFFSIGFIKYQICYTWPEPHYNETVTKWEWWIFWKNVEEIPLIKMNLYLGQHALTMLALCYLPGCFAAYIQLYRGTKYSRFPKVLDKWLKMRKQLGLLMLLSASLHVIILTYYLNILLSFYYWEWKRNPSFLHLSF